MRLYSNLLILIGLMAFFEPLVSRAQTPSCPQLMASLDELARLEEQVARLEIRARSGMDAVILSQLKNQLNQKKAELAKAQGSLNLEAELEQRRKSVQEERSRQALEKQNVLKKEAVRFKRTQQDFKPIDAILVDPISYQPHGIIFNGDKSKFVIIVGKNWIFRDLRTKKSLRVEVPVDRHWGPNENLGLRWLDSDDGIELRSTNKDMIWKFGSTPETIRPYPDSKWRYIKNRVWNDKAEYEFWIERDTINGTDSGSVSVKGGAPEKILFSSAGSYVVQDVYENGQKILVSSRDRYQRTYYWIIDSKDPVNPVEAELPKGVGEIKFARFFNNASRIAFLNEQGAVITVNSATGKKINVQSFPGPTHAFAISEDGGVLAFGGGTKVELYAPDGFFFKQLLIDEYWQEKTKWTGIPALQEVSNIHFDKNADHLVVFFENDARMVILENSSP